jgi:hypothetical protein
MIRGPVLPQSREALWPLVCTRLGRIETGLTLVHESFDCSDGALGPAAGLARDALGGAVLVLLAEDGDELLVARALSAGQFLQRVGDGLVRAVPEANLCSDVPSRVLIVGRESAASAIEQVAELPIVGLHACTLESFRLAGRDRFAVRWLVSPGAVGSERSDWPEAADRNQCPEFVPPPHRVDLWDALLGICVRIDASVTIDGDRYMRRISWSGNVLGEVRTVGGSLIASSGKAVVCDLRDIRDVNHFGNQLMRAFVGAAELDLGDGSTLDHGQYADREVATAPGTPASEVRDRLSPGRPKIRGSKVQPHAESLRSSLAASALSAEEYSALDDPALVVGPVVESPAAKDRS